MRFYILTLLGLVVLIAGVFPFSGRSEKKRTIAVFYPSPYGEYKDLRTEFLAVGSDVMDAQNCPYNDGEIRVEKRITFGKPFNPSPFSGGSGVPAISYDDINQKLDISSSDNDLVFGSNKEICMLGQTVEIEPYKSIQIGHTPHHNTNGNLVMTQEIKIIGEETNITNKSINISSPNGTVVIDFRGNDVQMNSSSPVSIYSTHYVSISARNSSLTVGSNRVDLNGNLCLNGECIGQWRGLHKILHKIKIVTKSCKYKLCTPNHEWYYVPKTCTAQCPRGWILISGGCRCKTHDLRYREKVRSIIGTVSVFRTTTIIENRPTNNNGWSCYGRCKGGIYAYAVCLKTDLN